MENSFSNKRLIAKNAIFLYLRMIVSILLGLFTSRYVLMSLGVKDYGLYNLVGGFVALLGIFTASVNGSCQRFLTYQLGQSNKDKLSETFCTISYILIGFSFVLLLLGSVLGSYIVKNYLNIPHDRIYAAIITYNCSLIIFSLELLSVPYTSLVIAHERMNFFAIMSLFESIMKFFLALSLLRLSHERLLIYSYMLVIISILSRLIYGYYCRMNFKESILKWKFDKFTFKEILSFSAWIGLGSFAGILKDQGGSILLNIFFGLTFNAAAGIAFQIKGLITNLSNNISLAISPQITKTFASGEIDKSVDLTFLLAKAEGLFMMLLILPLLSNTDFLLTVWLKNVPLEAPVFTKMISVFAFCNIFGLSYGPIFMALGKVKKMQIVFSSIVILVIPLSYLCYKFGLPPISYYIVCIVSEILTSLVGFLFLHHEIKFPIFKFFKDVYMRIVIIIILFIICQTFMSVFSPFIKLIISVFVYIVLAFFIGLSKKEQSQLYKIVKKKTCHYGCSSSF